MRVKTQHLISELSNQHEVILDAMKILDKVVASPDPSAGDLETLLRFAPEFVDGCHHSIEEYILFSGAGKLGFSLEGPIYVMVSEHGVGRYISRALDEFYRAWRAGDASMYGYIYEYAHRYIEHITQHIDKENNVLFPMLEQNFPEVDSSRSVDDIESRSGHDAWLRAVDELKAKY